MLHSLISQISIGSLIIACLFAFVKGGLAERYGAVIICMSWFGGYVISFMLKTVFSAQSRELTFLAMDAILALGMLALAFRFAKLWLGFAMLMLSGELALHGAAMGDWGFSFRDYIIFNNILSFGLLVLLIGATIVAWVQRGRKTDATMSIVPTRPSAA
jgi:hypothetical protein